MQLLKKRFSVLANEHWEQWYKVLAEDEAQAIWLVAHGHGDPIHGDGAGRMVDFVPPDGGADWLTLEGSEEVVDDVGI